MTGFNVSSETSEELAQYAYPVFTSKFNRLYFMGGRLDALLNSKDDLEAIIVAYKSNISVKDFYARDLNKILDRTQVDGTEIQTSMFSLLKQFIYISDLNMPIQELRTNIDYKNTFSVSATNYKKLNSIIKSKDYYMRVYQTVQQFNGVDQSNKPVTKMLIQLTQNIISGLTNVDYKSVANEFLQILDSEAQGYKDMESIGSIYQLISGSISRLLMSEQTMINTSNPDTTSMLVNALWFYQQG